MSISGSTASTQHRYNSGQAPRYPYEVVNTYPHDPTAFTEGLIYLRGKLYESTGREGQSSLREVQLETGEVIRKYAIPYQYFAEGLTLWHGRLIQLTWLSHVGFVYDTPSFMPVRTFRFPGDGWGLTSDGKRLIVSDGTSSLRLIDPTSFHEITTVTVRDGTKEIVGLNELEFVHGNVFANVLPTDRIAVIDLSSGRVVSWIDLSGLLPESDRQFADVLNGIAYDSDRNRLFVTGKLWPRLYQIRIP